MQRRFAEHQGQRQTGKGKGLDFESDVAAAQKRLLREYLSLRDFVDARDDLAD